MSDQEIEIYVDEAKKAIALGDSLVRLQKNRDFKRIVETAYINDESLRLVASRANTQLTEQQRTHILSQIDGIAHLQAFFNGILQQAHFAQEALEQVRESEADDQE